MVELNEPVVFLPGTLCDERLWLPCWRQLSINQRGYVPLQWAENLGQMLALTADRVDCCEQKVHLVGFSMGGYVASLYALDNPQNIASLTLVGYNPEGLTSGEIEQRQTILKTIAKGGSVLMGKTALANYLADENMSNSQVIDIIKDMERDLGSAVLAYHINSTTPRKALSNMLAAAPFPIHFIVGEEDKIAPPAAIQALHQQIPDSSYHQIKGSGHMLPLERTVELAQKLAACIAE